ncbi:MAG: ATP synthase F0 subunit B [Chloroflexi bacterium]|nr:MAG: ATP synthase F0 subunit B [Chloroflexota bacterium]
MFLLFQIVNFIVLAALLRIFLYKPVMGMLEQRRQRIEKGLEDARAAEEARAKAEEERQRILDQAWEEARRITGEATRQAEEVAKRIEAEAREQAREIVERAQRDAELERQKALGALRDQIALLSIAAANRILQEALDEQRQMALVRSFFSGIEAGKIQVLEEEEELEGEKAEVISAVPLEEDEKALYTEKLRERLGEGVAVEFKVDPSLMGGVVLRVGDRVIDNSMAGRLEALRRTLV